MSNTEYDDFADQMQRDHGGYESLEDVFNPNTTLGKDGSCIIITYSCPECGHKKNMQVGWPEVYAVAAGINPSEVGVQHTWQADAYPPLTTAFGPAMACNKCPRQEAPFVISFREAQGYLQKWPIWQRDAQIPTIKRNVEVLMQQRRAAAAAQAQHPGYRPG